MGTFDGILSGGLGAAAECAPVLWSHELGWPPDVAHGISAGFRTTERAGARGPVNGPNSAPGESELVITFHPRLRTCYST